MMENAIFPKRRQNTFFSERKKNSCNTFFSERKNSCKRGFTEEMLLPSTVGHESFRQHITRLYGEDTYHRIRQFEKLRTKREKSLCDLSFLLRCRDKEIIPISHKLHHSIETPTAQRILRNASMGLLRQSIATTYRRLDSLSKDLYDIHLTLSSEVHPIIFEQVDSITRKRAEHNALLTTEKQKKKFDKLTVAQKPPNRKQLDPSRVVINRSRHQLCEATVSVLSKGFNYAITPKCLPAEKIICGVETAIEGLPESVAERIRQDTAVILRRSHPPASNITLEEMRALKTLREREDIIVLPADKGNATVVLDSDLYRDKMLDLLKDPAYKPNKDNPTVYLEKKTRDLIMASGIAKEERQYLIPREKSSRIPKLYGLPKIHKEGMPLRPIVSAVNSPTQALARYLAKRLQPTAETARSYVKNSTHFVEMLHGMTTEPGDLLVSFDIVSLFTKIPVDEALDVIGSKHKPGEVVMRLIRHCMTSTYFVYDGQFYKQEKGAPMGSPLSPVVANLYLEDFETQAIESATLKPRQWLRYVDDTFVIWQHGREKLNEFLDHLNNQHNNIQFTMEIEKDDKLPFLDVLVYRKPDYSLGHTVYRKATHTNRYLNAASHHHPSQIRSVANTLATRSRRIADADNIKREERSLREALLMNGFPNRIIHQAWNREPRVRTDEENLEKPRLAFLPYVKGTTDRIRRMLAQENIKTIFNTDRKIGDLLRSSKDHIHLEGKGVYEIPCRECEQTYVGQTGRNYSIRQQEHRSDVENNTTTSSLVQHMARTKHKIDVDDMRPLVSVNSLAPRVVREAIEIERRPHTMNKRDDGKRLKRAWWPVLSVAPARQPNNNETHKRNTIGQPENPAEPIRRPVTRSQTLKAAEQARALPVL